MNKLVVASVEMRSKYSGVARVEKVGGIQPSKKNSRPFFGSRALLFWLVARYASQFSLFIDTIYVKLISFTFYLYCIIYPTTRWSKKSSGVARVEIVGGGPTVQKNSRPFFGLRALLFWLVARYASQFSLFIDTIYVKLITYKLCSTKSTRYCYPL